ncbi:MAG: hypothetical protein WD151_10315 [Phycisphaeraceae bacterium]
MLELLILYKMCSDAGKVLKRKGYRAGWWYVLMVALWFGVQFVVGLVGAVVMMIVAGPEGPVLLVYVAALVAAFVSAVLVTGYIERLPDRAGGVVSGE